MADCDGKRSRAPTFSQEATIDMLNVILREDAAAAEVTKVTRQRNAHIFHRIALQLKKAGHCSWSPMQVRCRWKRLKRLYIQDKQNSKKSSKSKRLLDPVYIKIMDKLMQQAQKSKGNNTSSRPVTRATCQAKPSSVQSSATVVDVSDADDDDDDEEDNEAQDDMNGASMMENIMNSDVVCIADETSGTESAELRSQPLTSATTSAAAAATESAPRQSSVQQGIRPRTLIQYKRRDNVADKLLAVMQKQTRLMEEEQAWRREYVASQQQWEERMLNAQMEHLQTMMVNVTKMIMPAIAGSNPATSHMETSAQPVVTVTNVDAMADLWATTAVNQL